MSPPMTPASAAVASCKYTVNIDRAEPITQCPLTGGKGDVGIVSTAQRRRLLLLRNVVSSNNITMSSDSCSSDNVDLDGEGNEEYDDVEVLASPQEHCICLSDDCNNTKKSISVSANFKCNDMECSLILGDYENAGFLGSFLSKGLKTNQLVVNTDEKTLRPIARLKEPRDLFALPKDKDHDCSQQAPRWPVECQVIEERITHIPYIPPQPEPLNMSTGNEQKPRPVGEENGIVVFSYSPISAVNYRTKSNHKISKADMSSDESDDSSDSHNESTPTSSTTPMNHVGKSKLKVHLVSKLINNLDNRSTSNSQDEDNDDDDDTSYDFNDDVVAYEVNEAREKAIIKDLIESKKKRYDEEKLEAGSKSTNRGRDSSATTSKDASEIDDIWKHNTSEYKPASPQYVLSQFGKDVSKAIISQIIDHSDQTTSNSASGSKVLNNKFAVTPIKLHKKNLTRLEMAFEQNVRQRAAAIGTGSVLLDPSSKSSVSSETDKDSEDSDDTDSDTGTGDDDVDNDCNDISDEGAPLRLAGGADRRNDNDSNSVSETETLVNEVGVISSRSPTQKVFVVSEYKDPPFSRSTAIIVGKKTLSKFATKANSQPTMKRALAGTHINQDNKNNQPGDNNQSSNNTRRTVPVTSPVRHKPIASHAATVAAASAAARAYQRHAPEQQQQSMMRMRSSDCASSIASSIVGSSNTTSTASHYNSTSTSASPSKFLSSMSSQEATNNIMINESTSQTTSSTFPLQFSRSAVGGAKFITNCHPVNPDEYDGLEFESRFESGNLAKAVQISPTYYELYLRPDLYTSRSKQWFYFRVRHTRRNMLYRFSIVNLVKSDSLYNDGMRPVMYSTIGAKEKSEGWRRCGNNICYYHNDDDTNTSNEEDEDNSSYTLTFTIEFEFDDDTVYFAHSYPYTYSDLQDYLMEIQRHPVKSKFCKLRLLCRTLAGNNVYYLTVTAPSANEENMRRKKSIVVSARVHPSETPSSWMMKGLMDFITSDTTVAKRLRHKFIFKLVPMLNPDGVIVGNTRNSLTGKDLNRQYRTVIRETYPSIWYTKAMIRRLIEECGVAMYCDMHAHSRKHNIFIYGCENKRNPEKKLTEQVFPLMLHKNSADRFSFESCKFKIQRSKEGTGRIVVWMLGITNSYTIEASFGGSSLGSRKGTHFNTQILNLLKQQERLRSKIIERLMREGSSADEPLNIPLSDYSSDEGNCSSSSDNEGKHSITASDLEGPCCAPTRAPPSSPEVMHEIRRFRMRRMNKVIHELDRIYFKPLFQRKLKTLARLKRRRHKLGGKVSKRLGGGGVATNNGTPTTTNAPAREDQMEVHARTQLGAKKVRRDSKLSIKQQHKSQQSPHQASKLLTTKQPIKQIKRAATAAASTDSVESGVGPRVSDISGSLSSQTPPDETTVLPNMKSPSRQRVKGTPALSSGVQSTSSSVTSKKKKKKFMPTEKNKQQVPKKVRINRSFRLWLANRQIFILRRKKPRRPRVRSKPQKKRAELVRTTLDLPTTDPGSDLHFSTDDEEHGSPANSVSGGVPPLRHTLLQSELQRRYIEEIGDTVVQKPKPAVMPPELIVTTPSKSGSTKKLDMYKLTPRTAPEQNYYNANGIGKNNNGTDTGTSSGARRTYSWHNLNQENGVSQAIGNKSNPYGNAQIKVQKPTPRRTVPSNFIPMAQQQRHGQASNTDELQMKLSLKKKIWTGASGEMDGRPIAAAAAAHWYKGNTHAAAAAVATAAAALRNTGGAVSSSIQARTMYTTKSTTQDTQTQQTVPPPAYVGAPRRGKKLEQVDLLNACSQKLVLWQQEEHKRVQSGRQKGGNGIYEQETQVNNIRGFKPMMAGKKTGSNIKNSGGYDPVNSKGKRKCSSMMKIAETTTLVTRFTRSRGGIENGACGVSSSVTIQSQQMKQRMLFKNQSTGARLHSGNGSSNNYVAQNSTQQQIYQLPQNQHGSGTSGSRAPNKFKTGGLVIAAVHQTGSNSGLPGIRKLRNTGNGTQSKSSGSTVANNGSMVQYRSTTNNLTMSKSDADISLDTVNLVRKVKTKLKKRKSHQLAGNAGK